MPTISIHKYYKARTTFKYFATQLETSYKFDNYIGFTHPGVHRLTTDFTFEVNEDELRRIEQMLSPHAHTLFKIWVIQQEANHE